MWYDASRREWTRSVLTLYRADHDEPVGVCGDTAMTLPLSMPYAPMEAVLVDAIPVGPGWQYEPKWDGFRCLAFRDGDAVDLQSKAGQPLGRYFPDLVAALQRLGARRFVLDGEITVPVNGRLSFD
jgi:ATP-dependent DNA ligase